VQSRLKEVSQTVISKEHLIRLTGLIVGYWFLYAFFTFYRVYEETISVRGQHTTPTLDTQRAIALKLC
jgi:hypothetical protein